MPRAKAKAIDVPGTAAEATALAAQYVTGDRRMLELRLGYQIQIDKLKAECAEVIAVCEADQQGRFVRLKAWWEAGGKDLAGKRRSAELAGALLGVRLTPAGVRFAKGASAKNIAAWLSRVVGGSALLRTKVELDKQAVIKALQSAAPMAGPLGEQGVSIKQTDEFFIDTQLDEAAIRARLGRGEG